MKMNKNPIKLKYDNNNIYFQLYNKYICKMGVNNKIYWITSPYLLPSSSLAHLSEKIKEIKRYDISTNKENIKSSIRSFLSSLFSYIYFKVCKWK